MWRLTIGGVDKTASIDAFSMSTSLNDRARAQVTIADELPPRYAELVSYAADGTTPLFGGLILQRHYEGRTQVDSTFTAQLECGDWFTYTDWVSTSAIYDVDVSLRTVLTDLVATHLGQYGITLDAAQATGPTLAPFTWTSKRVSDALRELADRTGYVARISAAKVLRMFPPGAVPAPFSMTEAQTNCHDVNWRDSDRTPYNTVVLLCGPGGLSEVDEEKHYGDGVRRRWKLYAPFSQIIGALITGSDATGNDPGGMPVGIFGTDDMPWTLDLATNELVQRDDQPVRQVGDYMLIWYTGAFPFEVRATTGETPPVEYAEARPEVRSEPVAIEIANQLLASFQAAPRELQITTDVDGLTPGHALIVDLPTIRGVSGTFLVTSVSMSIALDTVQGDRFWQYAIEAIESSLYQGSWLDDWRKITGIGGGGASSGSVSGGGSGGGTDEVFIGPGDPGDPFELWFDSDEPSGPFGGIGSGTVGYLAKWATPTTLTNGLISESGNAVLIEGSLMVTGSLTIPDHTLPLVKLQKILSQTILGRATSGTDTIEVLTTLPTGVQDRITRLGTVVSGTWQATPIGLVYLAGAGAAGTFVRSTGTTWATSTLLLPNAATFSRIVYATATNTYGESPNLTFTGTALALLGNMTLSGFIGSPSYASQTTGWRIDATGGADFRYLFVDEMHAKSFITDLEMALAGGQIISKSVAMVAEPFVVPSLGGSSTLRVRDLPSMPDQAAYQYGDTVVLRRFTRSGGDLTIAECIGQVSGYVDQADGTQTWTFIRFATDGGAMSGGTVPVDALALDYGVSGSGYYEVNAIDGTYGVNSPYAQIVTWTNSPTGGNKVVRARFGNLYGITGVGGEYGLIAGTYAATSGSYLRASNTAFELHNISASWWSGAVAVIQVSPGTATWGAPYISIGYPAPSAWGQAGVFMAYDGQGHAMFALTSLNGGTFFAFDGVTLWWKATNTELDTAGNLHATSATLSGAITATSGSITGDMVIGGGGQIRSGAQTFAVGTGWWLDYNGGVPRFRVGNPAADRITWDGSGVTVRSHDLLIDGSAGGHVGMGASPYTLATLNVASATNDTSTWGLVVSNASGNANFICYGDGSVYINSLIRSNPTLNHTGAGTNPPSVWNGPFGTSELDGWWQLIINGVTSWIPVWQ